MNKKYVVQLNSEERERIEEYLHHPSTCKGIRQRCLILMLVDESKGPLPTQAEIAQRVGVSDVTLYHTVKAYCTEGLDAALCYRKSTKPKRPVAITGEVEARIIALACSEPPTGYARWTVRLLTKRVVELDIIESVGRETIRKTLKKRNLSLI